MLAYYTKRSQGEEFERLSKPHAHNMWVDGSKLNVEELNGVVKAYGLDANIVYDVRDRQELSRLEFKNDTAYIFLRVPHIAHSGRVIASPMLVIVRPKLFMTLSQAETFAPEAVAATTLPIDTNHTTDLLLGVIAACVDEYQELIKHTERGINDTGTRLKTHEVTNADFIHFVTVEDNLTAFRMNLDGILSVTTRLFDTQKLSMSEDNREALDDISQHIKQLLVAVESYGGRVKSIRNAYSTIADNSLNQRMKTLTVLTVLITLPNIMYGMFGMNVSLPFADSPWAYLIVVGLSIIVTFTIYLIGRGKRLF
jgi:magnesium transporter